MTLETLQEEEKPEQEEQDTEDTSKNENLEKEPEEVHEEPEEEESVKEVSEDSDQETKGKDKKKISVTEYGIKSGPAKCPVCTRAFKFFQSPKIKRYFNFKYADLLKEKHRKVADKEGFDSMPFFKVRRPGNDKSEFIVGFIESDFEEMIGELKS